MLIDGMLVAVAVPWPPLTGCICETRSQDDDTTTHLNALFDRYRNSCDTAVDESVCTND